MATLTVEEKLRFAQVGVRELRALQKSGQKMRYQAFARAIGLMQPSDHWDAKFRTLTLNIMVIMAAVERWGGVASPPLVFDSIVTESGRPGAGFVKESRIRRSKPKP